MDNEVDKFLNDTNGDENPFKEEAKDPFESVIKKEEKVVEDTVTEEKPLPFHKDPKVQRYIEKEIAKKLGSNPTPATAAVMADEADEILTRIIGNDTPERVQAIKDFKKYLSSIEEKGAQKALSTIQQQQEEERKAEAEASEALDNGFESIEESYGVDLTSNNPTSKKMRTDFIEFIKRVSPKDENGNVVQFPDIPETFALFQEVNKSKSPSNSKAKELASRSMARSGDSSNTPVSKDNSWRAVDKIFSKLS